MIDSSVIPQQSVWKTRLAVVLPLAGYCIFIAESMFARPNPAWALLLLLWALSAALFAWWIVRGGARGIFDWVERHASTIAISMIAVTATILIVASVLQARYFAAGAHAEDTAYYGQVLWNTLHGDFLSGNVQQERLYNPPVSNDLALHVSPVLVVGFLPLYALFPHPLTLLIIRDIALAAAAWPLFLLARERMGGTAGIASVMLYLANPAVIAQAFEAFYLLQLAPLPFFWALRAFVRGELGGFLCWMGVALSLREDVAIAMAGFGLWAIVKGRGLRWWVGGLGIPIVWWLVTTLLIQPAFGRWGNSAFDVAIAGGSRTPLGAYRILLGNASWLLEGLREGGVEYLYRMLRPVAFLGMMGWEGLLATPILAANLFLARVFYSGGDALSRFAILPSCALIGAAVVIVSRMGQKLHQDVGIFAVVILLLLPSVSLLDGAKDAVQTRLGSYTVQNDAVALWQAVERIPDTASVAAPNYALPALSNRSKLFYLQYLHQYPQAKPDYVLLDRSRDRMPANPELRERYLMLLHTLSSSSAYETVWQHGEYLLLRQASHNP